MATKNELETRLGVLEQAIMDTSRGLRTEVNSLVELMVKVRNDLDRTRAEVERLRNTVDTIKNLQANYDVQTIRS